MTRVYKNNIFYTATIVNLVVLIMSMASFLSPRKSLVGISWECIYLNIFLIANVTLLYNYFWKIQLLKIIINDNKLKISMLFPFFKLKKYTYNKEEIEILAATEPGGRGGTLTVFKVKTPDFTCTIRPFNGGWESSDLWEIEKIINNKIPLNEAFLGKYVPEEE